MASLDLRDTRNSRHLTKVSAGGLDNLDWCLDILSYISVISMGMGTASSSKAACTGPSKIAERDENRLSSSRS